MGETPAMKIEEINEQRATSVNAPPNLEDASKSMNRPLPQARDDGLEFCQACQGEGMITVMEPVSKLSKLTRHMRQECEKCQGEGMIDRRAEQRKKEREEEAKRKAEAEAAARVQTPQYTLNVENRITVREEATPAGVESIADSHPSHVVLKIELPKVEAVADIDAEVVERDYFELEVLGVYWLEVRLPHVVDDEAMECAFSKESKMLTVRVPVILEGGSEPEGVRENLMESDSVEDAEESPMEQMD